MTTQEQGRTTTRRLVAALAGVGTLVTIVGAGAGIAYAATPVSDYASYPAALPSGCPTGAWSLEGLRFADGRGATAATLGDLDVRHGDTVTMSWTGFAKGCTTASGDAAITVSLAAYDSPTPTFDAEADQQLQAGWASCGPDAGRACTPSGGRMSLSVTLPSTAVCNVQLDAVQGLPLAVVGPSGSYYSDWQRKDGSYRLISAANFGLEPCVAPTPSVPETTTAPAPPAPEATTTTAPPAPPAAPVETTTTAPAPMPVAPEAPSSAAPEVTTTTAPPVVVPQSTPPTTTPPTTTPPTTSTTGPTEVLDASITAPTPTVASAGVLPFTGSNTFGTLRLAAWLTGVGGAILLAAGALHLQRRRPA